MADSLAPADVGPLLRGRFGSVYRYAESAPSTQRMLEPDDPEGAVAVAEEQTAGRGRLGRSWEAPAGAGILCSVKLVPAVPPPRLPELSLVAGRAVAAAIEEVTRLTPTVKFPNDILVDGRKVAGILAESSEGRVVLGIGVNVNQTATQLPSEARTHPTSLRIEVGAPIDRPALLAAILLQLELEYDRWVSDTAASG